MESWRPDYDKKLKNFENFLENFGKQNKKFRRQRYQNNNEYSWIDLLFYPMWLQKTPLSPNFKSEDLSDEELFYEAFEESMDLDLTIQRSDGAQRELEAYKDSLPMGEANSPLAGASKMRN